MKNRFSRGVVGFLAAGILFGCLHDGAQPPSPLDTRPERAINNARLWLEAGAQGPLLPDTYHKGGANSLRTRSEGPPTTLADAIEADWSRAWTWESDGGTVAEVPTRLVRPVSYATLIRNGGDTVS